MARLFRDHGQGEQAKLAVIEWPAAAASAITMSVMPVVVLPVTAVRQVIGLSETTV